MSEQRVQVTIENHVANVVLVRPEKHNALDMPMFRQLAQAALDLRDNPEVWAVVISGEGPSFCSGLDVMGVASEGEGAMDELLATPPGEIANLAQAVSHNWRLVQAPVIAAIHGNCLGGGLQIALGADIRIATADAKLSVMEIKWGLIPDMALTAAVPQLLRQDVAKELTFTGRIVSGTEAQELGLVTHVNEDPLAAARELAATIAGKSPDAVRAGKRLLNEAWRLPDAESLELEEQLQRSLVGSTNAIASATAAIMKQPPEFVAPELPPAR